MGSDILETADLLGLGQQVVQRQFQRGTAVCQLLQERGRRIPIAAQGVVVDRGGVHAEAHDRLVAFHGIHEVMPRRPARPVWRQANRACSCAMLTQTGVAARSLNRLVSP